MLFKVGERTSRNHVEVDMIIIASLPSRCRLALKFVYVSRWYMGRSVLISAHGHTDEIL
jgi:hypothetical protein